MRAKPMWPKVPVDAEEAVQLKEDLERMGLGHLLTVPWGFQDPVILGEMTRELEIPLGYERTIRGRPTQWTPELIAKIYRLSNRGALQATQKETSGGSGVEKCLDLTKAKAKDGFTASDILQPRLQRVFGFLIPILNADHPDRFFKGLAVTIILSYLGKRETNWAAILYDTIRKGAVSSNRGSYSSSFCYHIYHHAKVLRPHEVEEYEKKAAEWEFGAHEEAASPEPVVQPERREPAPQQKRPAVPGKKKPPPPPNPSGESEEEEVQVVARRPPPQKKPLLVSSKRPGIEIGDRRPSVRQPAVTTVPERATADSGA